MNHQGSAQETIGGERVAEVEARVVGHLPVVMADFLEQRRSELSLISPESAHLVDLLQDYLDGGKLLRPRFLLWGALAADADALSRIEEISRLGVAVELVQAAALLHDDVIDDSSVRRGRPALHVERARMHRRHGLTGDPEDFGRAVAIVLGDLALTWSEQATSGPDGACSGEEPGQRAARAEFDLLRTEVMAGQHLDILHQAAGFTSPRDPETAARAVIRWKTVPYTVLRPIRMGARLCGMGPEDLAALDDYAVRIGTAFQLRDDVLSVTGEPDLTGKPVGGDITEGKQTVLLARARAVLSASDRERLDQVVGDPRAESSRVQQACRLLVDCGAVASVLDEVGRLGAAGIDALDQGPGLNPLGRAGLERIARAATDVSGLSGVRA